MRVVLCGAKASGKSTIGNALARRLGTNFIDLDDVILTLAKMRSIDAPSCAEIYRRHGEALFRRLEQEAILEIRNEERCILSTGGSTLLDPISRHRLREKAVWVFLDASSAYLWDRVSVKRLPAYLESSASPAAAFAARVSRIRETVTPLCDHLIPVEDRTPAEIVTDIVNQLSRENTARSNAIVIPRE